MTFEEHYLDLDYGDHHLDLGYTGIIWSITYKRRVCRANTSGKKNQAKQTNSMGIGYVQAYTICQAGFPQSTGYNDNKASRILFIIMFHVQVIVLFALNTENNWYKLYVANNFLFN